MMNTDKLNREDTILITVDELAAFAGIGINTAHKLAKKEGFPCVKVGSKKMIIKSQLEKWFIKHIGDTV